MKMAISHTKNKCPIGDVSFQDIFMLTRLLRKNNVYKILFIKWLTLQNIQILILSSMKLLAHRRFPT